MTDTPDKPDKGRTRSAALRAKFLRNTDPPSPERVAAFKREMMLERQREGIAAAKAAGKYKGCAPTARAQADAVRQLVAEGVSKSEIARRLGMHRASVHRILAANSKVATLSL